MNWHRKTVLVTGGAGFLGSHLVKRLSDEGAKIFVVDNFIVGKKQKLQDVQCDIIQSNVTDINQIRFDMDSLDFIFHLGAPSSDVLFREKSIDCLSDTINGFIEVLKFAKQHEVQKLIYTTSSSVYGSAKPPQSEDSPTHPTNLYGIAKLICENIAKADSEVKSLGLRIFAGYGPGEEHKGKIASVVTIFMHDILTDQKPILYGDGTQKRDFIYVTDIIDALIRGAETDLEGIVNLGTGYGHSFLEVLAILWEKLGAKEPPIFVPVPAGYFIETQADISHLKRCLGIQPIALKDGIERYVRLIRDQKRQPLIFEAEELI